MSITYDFFFYSGLSLLIVHEMDAIHNREWRMFYGLSKLNDTQGYQIFGLLHIPLLACIFWILLAAPETIVGYLQLGLDVFFMIHFFLHLLFLKHRNNGFKSIFSWSLISGLFILGLLHSLQILQIVDI